MIQLDSIVWSAGAFRLDNVSFTVPAGKYAVLMGRTGCGKTTLLEIICGLRQPRRGRVIVADRDVTHELPGERGIGYVPQDGAMFPTFTVREQLGFALRLRRRPSDEINTRVSELAGELGVAHLLDRLPQHLASASPSAARSRQSRRCSCSTSRSPRSTRNSATISPRCSSACSANTASPRCTSRTAAPRPPRSRMWSFGWMEAVSWRRRIDKLVG